MELRKKYKLGVIGGSNLEKILYQLGSNAINEFDYVFAENGLIAYGDGNLLGVTRLEEVLDINEIEKIKTFVYDYVAMLNIPVKRSIFIEIRSGMMNISPIGRDCTDEERVEFNIYDTKHRVRERMIEKMKQTFPYLHLEYVIGGMISFDVYPSGWDKTFCLRYIHHFNEIVFFGDKTEPGGNDYALFMHPKVLAMAVKHWRETRSILKTL